MRVTRALDDPVLGGLLEGRVAAFADEAAFKYQDLIGSQHPGLWVAHGNGNGLLSGKIFGDDRGRRSSGLGPTFIYVGRIDCEWHAGGR